MVEDLITIRKSSTVKRFHVERTIQEYSVGFHTHNVLTIIHYLASLNNVPRVSMLDLFICGLYHDAHEQYTGDLPANFKWGNKDLEEILEQIEKNWEIDNLPREFTISKSVVMQSRKLRTIFKQSDLLELGFFIKDEMDMGNKNLEPVMQRVITSSININEKTRLIGIVEIVNYLYGEKAYE